MTTFGAIAVPIDALPDEVRVAVKKAEKQDGYGYGAFFDDGRLCFVSVLFYPSRRWVITYDDDKHEPLTKEVFARLERIRL